MTSRLDRPPGHLPAIAVAGSLEPGVLTAAGWRVTGRLPATPYDDPRDSPSYVDVDELLADERVDAVALDGDQPDLAALLPAVRGAGLLVLLTGPAPLDPDLLRRARGVLDAPEVAVAFVERWEPWALTVAAALPLAGGPPLQVTVRGWPRGQAAAAELVDLVASWCGEVAAVAASPHSLPARVLPGGAQVAWSLLTGSGATVLVSHDGGPPLVRLSMSGARLEAGPLGARWEGGAELALLPAPDRRPDRRPAPPGTSHALLATAYALTRAVGGGAVAGRGAGGDDAPDRPQPADLGDLLVAARVLEALRTSARTGELVRTG